MSNSSQLIEALWAPFRAEIATGDPVSFCFHQDLVRELLVRSGLDATAPLETICEAARAFLIVEERDVSLREGALKPIEGGMSAAIILVSQQVLAVEEMIRDGAASENAYFPRLRRLISPTLGAVSANPFPVFEEFEEIWRVFRKEALSIAGSSEATITFKLGVYRGIDKSRLFPLSQALLSRADLSELLQLSQLKRLREPTEKEVWAEIRRARGNFSRRGQQLINSHLLKDQVIRQVRSFIKRHTALGISSGSGSRLGDLEFRVALDSSDWMQEEYRPFVVAKGRSEGMEDEALIQEKLRALLAPREYFVLLLSEAQDYWAVRETESELAPAETILVIGTVQGMQMARGLLEAMDAAFELAWRKTRQLGDDVALRVCKLTVSAAMSATIRITSGAITRPTSSTGLSIVCEWIGGVCVDARARKYLREALPHAIKLGKDEYAIGEVIRVGERTMSFESLLKEIGKLEEDAAYSLLYPNGKVTRLAIGVCRNATVERHGFLIDANGYVSPVLDSIRGSDPALIGFSEPSPAVVRPAAIRDIARLIQDLLAGQGRPLTNGEKARVLRKVSASSAPPAVKRAVSGLLAMGAMAQDSTIAQI